MDLKSVFEANGIYDVFRKKRGICGVDYEKIGCDYFIWSENTVASALGERKKDVVIYDGRIYARILLGRIHQCPHQQFEDRWG